MKSPKDWNIFTFLSINCWYFCQQKNVSFVGTLSLSIWPSYTVHQKKLDYTPVSTNGDFHSAHTISIALLINRPMGFKLNK